MLEPVYRLDRELAAVPSGARGECAVGEQLRPAIGCLTPQPLATEKRKVGPNGRVSLVVALPVRRRSPRPLLVEVRVWEPRKLDPRDTRVFVTRRGQRRLKVDVPVEVAPPGKEVVIAVLAHELPTAGKRWTTRPLRIPEGAVLQVGLGIDPLAVLGGAAPAELRLVGQAGSGPRQVLLHQLIQPSEKARWRDETVDLGAFAGETLRLTFEVLPRPERGAAPLTAFTVGVWGAPRILAPRLLDGRYNLLLVSLDTLRADSLGREVDGAPLMPRLDALAAAGASFTDVLSTYPSTSAAHMSLLTSKYPSAHGVTFPTESLPSSIPTLAEVLAGVGFSTAAVTEDGMLATSSGFHRGFDFYREFSGSRVWKSSRQVERTFDAGLRWVDRHKGERFFLFLHTYQVHNPYNPPPEYAPRDERGRTSPRARYEGEVRFTDAVLGELLDGLDRLGVLGHTIVAVTSDHGEEFYEHRSIGHARTVYEEVIRVPLVLWGPGSIPRGRVVDQPASLLDVVPTVLELFDISPPPGVQGRSLVPAMQGDEEPGARIRYAEGPGFKDPRGGLLLARDGPHKWIARRNALDEQEIFDLTQDPGEQQPLDDPALRARGMTLLGDFPDVAEGAREKPPERTLDAETEERLRALGYIE